MDANSINVEVESINKELTNLKKRVSELNKRKKDLKEQRLKIAEEKEETSFMWQGKKVQVVETVRYSRKPDKAKRADVIGVFREYGIDQGVDDLYRDVIEATRRSRTIVDMK